MKIFDATNQIVLCTQLPERRFVLAYGVAAFAGIAIALTGHVLLRSDFLISERFSIYHDRGYPEYFQYTLAIIAGLSFLYVALTKRRLAYLVPAGIMGYLFIDDAFQIHERAGAFIASDKTIIEPAGLNSIHMAEMLYLSIAGIVFLGVLLIAWLHAEEKVRFDLVIFTIALFFAGVFGIIFDALSAVTHIRLFGFAEDSGEMLSVALLSIFAVDRATNAFVTVNNSVQNQK